MTLDLNGLIPATILPMHADGSIDEPALRSYIGWITRQGPVALAINVDTGEGPHLTHEEKVRVLEVVRDETELPIVAGLAGPSTDAAVGSEMKSAFERWLTNRVTSVRLPEPTATKVRGALSSPSSTW